MIRKYTCKPMALLLLLACLTGSLPGCTTASETEPIPTENTGIVETADTTRDTAQDTIRETKPETAPETEPEKVPPTGEQLSQTITALPDSEILRQTDIADVITAANLDTLTPEIRFRLAEALTGADTLTAFRKAFHEITGYTFHGWREVLQNASTVYTSHTDGKAELIFTGDVCLGDEWYNMVNYHQKGSRIENNIKPELRSWLAGGDITLMNCECTLSDRGEPTPGKLYTFRGKPENGEIFTKLGVDIVSLANNHAHDYGKDAFLDTMTALEEAGVAYVGAGENLTEAMAYKSFVADGMKIAYVAASNAEKYRLTPGATDNTPGILLMYETDNVAAAIQKAAREADVVVVYVHWGTENSTKVNRNQQDLRDLFIQCGADVIVGAHTHVLQPWEMYEGVPVVYSLGNFWFNMETLDTALASVQVALTEEGVEADCELYACVQTGGVTGFAHEFEG